MVSHGRMGDRLERPPGGVIELLELRQRSALVLEVAQGQDRRIVAGVDDRCRLRLLAARAARVLTAGNVAGRRDVDRAERDALVGRRLADPAAAEDHPDVRTGVERQSGDRERDAPGSGGAGGRAAMRCGARRPWSPPIRLARRRASATARADVGRHASRPGPGGGRDRRDAERLLAALGERVDVATAPRRRGLDGRPLAPLVERRDQMPPHAGAVHRPDGRPEPLDVPCQPRRALTRVEEARADGDRLAGNGHLRAVRRVLVPRVRLTGARGIAGEDLQDHVDPAAGCLPPARDHAAAVAGRGEHEDDGLAADPQVARRSRQLQERGRYPCRGRRPTGRPGPRPRDRSRISAASGRSAPASSSAPAGGPSSASLPTTTRWRRRHGPAAAAAGARGESPGRWSGSASAPGWREVPASTSRDTSRSRRPP